jgi:putative DNA primase/helicase
MTVDYSMQFRDAIARAGLTPPDAIEPDGELHRFASNGKRNDDAGWYVYHADGVAAGSFGDWRTGLAQTWRANIGRKLAPIEAAELTRRVAAAKAKREADEVNRHAEARARAAATWQAAKAASAEHPYLRAKGVKPHGIRQSGDDLLIPMRDAGGELHSLQTIAPDGTKLFVTGGRVAACYHSIGKPDGAICIAEGYATAASIHEATGHAVAVAFNAGNLAAVARELRAKLHNVRIIVCADDDYRTDGNPGLTKATQAARAVGGILAVPGFRGDRPEAATDFNDLHRQCGAAAVERAVANARALEPPEDQPGTPSVPAADPALRVLTLAELVSHQFPEREEILAPWLLTQSLSMLHAWRGIGKTHVALGIAYAVATCGEFLTWRAPAPRRVLYVDGEMPGAALKGRFAALVEADERDFDPDYLRIVTPDAQDGPMPDLATTEGQAAIASAARDAELIILDNLSTLCRSAGPENDAESWRAPQEWALQMRRAGKAVLFVHHSGKGGAQRGSSKREDTLDVVINLKRPPDYADTDGARFELRYEKFRNGAGDAAKPIEAKLSQDEHGRAVWTWRSVDDSTFDRVVGLAGDGLKAGEIALELGLHKSNVSRHLKKARALGLVKGANHGD